MYEVYSMYVTDSLCLGSVWGLGLQTRRASGSYRAGAASRDRDGLWRDWRSSGRRPRRRFPARLLWALGSSGTSAAAWLGCAWMCLGVPPGLAVPGLPCRSRLTGLPCAGIAPQQAGSCWFVLSACCIFGSQSIPACLQTPRPDFVVAHSWGQTGPAQPGCASTPRPSHPRSAQRQRRDSGAYMQRRHLRPVSVAFAHE